MAIKGNYKRTATIPANTTIEVKFKSIREYEDPQTGETKCFFVSIEGYKDVQVPYFGADQNNFEFENLQDELGIPEDKADDLEFYNTKAGTVIKVTGIQRASFINAHFGDAKSLVEDSPFFA